MRKLCVLFIMLILALTGCQDEINGYEAISSSLLPKNIPEIEIVDIKLITKSKQNIEGQDWSDFLNKKYNINLQVVPQVNNDALTTINQLLENNEMNGLIYLWWGEMFDMIPNPDKYFIPLDEILSQNSIWNARADDYRNFGLHADKIWGIPTQYRDSGYLYKLRLYNGDILEKLNVTHPDTLNQFYETMVKIAERDMVRSPMLYSNSNPFEDFYDIFWTNNIPIISTDNRLQSIAYNFEENSFIDYAEYEDMKNSIYFIKLLIEAGLINEAEIYEDIDSLFYKGETATVMNTISDRCRYSGIDNIQYSLGFTEMPTAFKIPVLKTNGMYAILKDTKEPEKIVNKFIDSFLGSEEDNVIAFMGQNKAKYEIENNVIAYKGNIMKEAPNIFGLVLMDRFVISTNPQYSPANTNETDLLDKHNLYKWNENIEIYNNITENREFISIPPAGMYIRGTSNDILSCFQQTFSSLFNKDASIEDLYYEYQINMRKMGAQDYIDELNDKLKN